MKVLSVRQPWASLIESGCKTIELRTWTTKYRGPILIHASRERSRTPNGLATRSVEGDATPTSTTLCVVDLLDVRPATPADASAACCTPDAGEFAWVLGPPRPVRHVRCKGALGLRNPSPELLATVIL